MSNDANEKTAFLYAQKRILQLKASKKKVACLFFMPLNASKINCLLAFCVIYEQRLVLLFMLFMSGSCFLMLSRADKII